MAHVISALRPAWAVPGAPVSIEGIHLPVPAGGPPHVLVGAADAHVLSASHRAIRILVPADADPTDVKTFIAMGELQQALEALPCRHLLLVLVCCFSGAFKWSSNYRAIGTLMPKRIYKERFDRFIEDPAWQVITSAAYDQKALDVLDGKATGDRGVVRTISWLSMLGRSRVPPHSCCTPVAPGWAFLPTAR